MRSSFARTGFAVLVTGAGRLILAAGVVLALAGMMPARAHAQSIPVSLGGEASSLPNEAFSLPLQVDMSGRPERLGSFALRVSWNPLVVQVLGGQDGNFGSITANEDSLAQGVLRLSGANPVGATGKVILGIAHVVPLLADTTTFKLQVTELYAAGTFADLTSAALPINRMYCNGRGHWGDTNSDNVFDSHDALAILTAAAGLTVPSGDDPTLGDVDGDGVSNPRDALILLSKAAGLDDVIIFRLGHVAPGSCATGLVPGTLLDLGDIEMLPEQSVLYTALFRDASGNVVSASHLTWRSSNPAVAQVFASGEVEAYVPGTTTILVSSGSGVATATVTVLPGRRTHWVDALAFQNGNQLGSAKLPFATIGAALNFAGPGDTVRIRSAPYREEVRIDQDVVVVGETLAGTPPVLSPSGNGLLPGITINSGSVELRNLRLDGYQVGVSIPAATRVVLDSVDIWRSGCLSVAALVVGSEGGTVEELRVLRSHLISSTGTTFCEVGGIGLATDGLGVKLAVLDSVTVSGFGNTAVSLAAVDSAAIRRSVFTGNQGSAIVVAPLGQCGGCCIDCAPPTMTNRAPSAADSPALLVENSRFTLNRNAITTLGVRSVMIRDNVIDMGQLNGTPLQLTGSPTGVATLLRDSIRFAPGAQPSDAPPVQGGLGRSPSYFGASDWIFASSFGQLIISSTRVSWAFGGTFSGIGQLQVDHSSLVDVGGFSSAFDVFGSQGSPTNVAFDSVSVKGMTTCTDCGEGIQLQYASGTLDRVRIDQMSTGLDLFESPVVITNSVITNVFDGIDAFSYGDPGFRLEVRNSLIQNAVDAVSTDNVATVVDQVTATALIGSGNFNTGISMSGSGADTVTRSTLQDFEQGIEGLGSTSYLAQNTITRPSSNAIYLDFPGSASDTSYVLNNSITCAQGGSGIQVYSPNQKIVGNTLSACDLNIYLSDASAVDLAGAVVRGNVINAANNSSYAAIHYENRHGEVVGNHITGGGVEGGIGIFGRTSSPVTRVRVDSNTVQQARSWGIRSDFVDSISVRANLIEDLQGSRGAQNRTGGISIGDAQYYLQIVGNTLRRVHGAGIVVDQQDNFREQVDTALVVIDTNAVSAADTAAVLMHSGTLVMRNNNIRNNPQYGVHIVGYPINGGQDALHGNAFKSNALFALAVNIDSNVDATGNWWGADDPDGTAPGLQPGDPGTDLVTGFLDATLALVTEPLVPNEIPALARPILASASARVSPMTATRAAVARTRPVALSSAPVMAAPMVPVPRVIPSGNPALARIWRLQEQIDAAVAAQHVAARRAAQGAKPRPPHQAPHLPAPRDQ